MGHYIPSDCYLVKWRFSIVGKSSESIITMGLEDANQAYANAQAVAAAASTTFQAGFGTGEFGTYCSLVGLDAYRGNGVDPPTEKGSYNLPTPYTGTGTATYPPPNVAIVCKKVTALIGRKYRGRLYLPSYFCTEAMVDNLGNLTSGGQTLVNGSLGMWKAALQALASPLNPVLIHSNAQPLIDPTPITELKVAPRVGTQRRRLG